MYDNKKLPNSILLNGQKGLGKSTFASNISLALKTDFFFNKLLAAYATRYKYYSNCNYNKKNVDIEEQYSLKPANQLNSGLYGLFSTIQLDSSTTVRSIPYFFC